MNKIYYDKTEYKVNSIIPNWNKYKFHCVLFRLYTPSSIMQQIQVTGTNEVYYNDNNINVSIGVQSNGNVSVSGSNFVTNSKVTEIYMWN